MSNLKSAALVSALAVSLAACGGEAEEPVAENAEADAETTQVVEYDPMTRDYSLSETAQERRAGFDGDAFQTEYAGYRDEIVQESVSEPGEESDDMTDDDRTEMQAASQARDANTNMRTRENMTWGYLDRNDDNRLSVAEYAIWAIPLDPEAGARNDETAPYLTAEQANKAADSFFYYDLDGDTYLDRREFTAARRGENFDS